MVGWVVYDLLVVCSVCDEYEVKSYPKVDLKGPADGLVGGHGWCAFLVG